VACMKRYVVEPRKPCEFLIRVGERHCQSWGTKRTGSWTQVWARVLIILIILQEEIRWDGSPSISNRGVLSSIVLRGGESLLQGEGLDGST